MSPILVRPVREQLEHDRVIRLLQHELSSRKVEVGINPGSEQNAAVGIGGRKEYPDVVIYSTEKGRKLVGVVEVETGESVNNLEAMAQWAHLARLKVPFRLYVPMGSVDVARRLSADNQIHVTEIWSYHQVGEQVRFTLIHRNADAGVFRGPSTRTVVIPRPQPARPLPEAAPAPNSNAAPAPNTKATAKPPVQATPAAQPAAKVSSQSAVNSKPQASSTRPAAKSTKTATRPARPVKTAKSGRPNGHGLKAVKSAKSVKAKPASRPPARTAAKKKTAKAPARPSGRAAKRK